MTKAVLKALAKKGTMAGEAAGYAGTLGLSNTFAPGGLFHAGTRTITG
jgi:hypothetical protein